MRVADLTSSAKGCSGGVISLADVADVESDEEAGEALQQVKSDQPAAH